MKKLLLAGVVVFAGVSSASAADLIRQPTFAEPAPAPAPVLDNRWGGIYVGGLGTYGFTRDRHSSGGVSTNMNVDGFAGGLTAGYNHQMGQTVLGIEGDISYGEFRGSSSGAAFCGGNCYTEMNWLGTVRARAGYAAGNFMPYVTGGLAIANVKAGNATSSSTRTAYGLTGGLGLEYLVTDNVSVKGEYLYTRFDRSVGYTPGSSRNRDLNTVRAGVNVRF